MHKRLLALLVISLMLVTTIGISIAMAGGNYRKGKYLFRKNCRVCHTGTKAKELSPISKTQADWKAALAPDKVTTYKCKDAFAKLSKKDLNDIASYLIKFAKDSPTPLKCK